MSKSEESNPFYCDDDMDEVDDDQQLQQTRAKIDRAERQQLQSLDRTLRVCHETEEIGFRTAEEMCRQTEVLENTEKKLDSIIETTKVTQRHITSIKSVFGALKNRLFSRAPVASETETSDGDIQHSRLKETVDEYGERSVSSRRIEHSAASSDLWDADEDCGFKDISHTTSRQADFDSKLGDISASMGVLKNLAKGMNTHLNQEEQLLDRVGAKSQQADMTIQKQNKQLRGLLK